MMIVICEECGQKYRLDPARIIGTEARFACKTCGHLLTAARTGAKPAPAAAVIAETKTTPDILTATDSGANPQPLPKEPQKKPFITNQVIQPIRFRFGLTAKLFTVLISVSLIPLVIFFAITLSLAKERLRTEATTHSAQLFVGMVRYVNEWFHEKERTLQALAEMDAVVSMERARQESLLADARKINPLLKGLFVVDAGGNFFAGDTDLPPHDYPALFSSQNLTSSQTPLWQVIKNTKTGKPVLIAAAPIKNQAGIAGSVVHAIPIDKISKQILSYDAGIGGLAFLVKQQRSVDAYSIDAYGFKQQKPLNWSPLIGAYKNGRTGLVSIENQKEKFVLGYVGRTKFGWGIAIQKDDIEVSALIDQLMSFAYLLLAIIIVFVSIIAWFSGRALSRPIIRLTDAANRISIGELDMEIETKRKDEIGDLAEAIARMQDSIRISIERLRRRL